MQIRSVQNYNNNQKPAFTSKVRMHCDDVRIISQYPNDIANTIVEGIKQLQKNGNNDRVFVETRLSYCNMLTMLVNVVKKEGDKLLLGTAQGSMSESPAKIYEEAIKDMKPTEDNPLYFGLNKVHMFFEDMKKAGKSQKYIKQLMDLEKTVKEGDSVSITPIRNAWTNIWMDVIRKVGEIYNKGSECVDVYSVEFYHDPLVKGYEMAIKSKMEPNIEYNSNQLYFDL